MNIHAVNHAKGDKNAFCGPSALSIITGMSSGEGARLIRKLTGRQSVTGTDTEEMRRALSHCNLASYPITPPDKPTLAQWLKDTAAIRTAGRVFLLVAGNHWQVISGRRYACGITGSPVPFTHEKVKRRARVTEVYEVKLQPRRSAIVIPDFARKPATVQTGDPSRAKLRALERQYGFKGKLEWNSGVRDYVVPECDVFWRGYSTMHHDWWETLDRVQAALLSYDDLVDEDGHHSR